MPASCRSCSSMAASSLVEECANCGGELAGPFPGGQVRRFEFEIVRRGNSGCERTTVGRRSRWIMPARDYESRCTDGYDACAKIGFAQHGAAAAVAIGVSGRNHLLNLHHLGGMGLAVIRREPAGGRGLGQGFHSGFADGDDALVPEFGAADAGSRVGEDHATESLGCMKSEPHTQESAQGQAAEIDPIEIEFVEEMQYILSELIERVWAGRNAARAVAARVIAKHAVVCLYERKDLIPHAQAGAE